MMIQPAIPSPIFKDASTPWAVDMDGTLIKEDVTELSVSLSRQQIQYWPSFFLFCVLWYSVVGRITAYRLIERVVPVNPAKLSYNDPLMEMIQEHRQNGGVSILATASHVHAGRRVAQYVQKKRLFDEILGSSPPKVWDACGHSKAELLHEKFTEGFIYAGNSPDDLEVWSHEGCKAMLLVNCSPDVLEKAKKIDKPYIVVESSFGIQ